MHQVTRRNFIKTSSGLLGALAINGTFFSCQDKKLPLAFSTLGCPTWPFPDILDFAGKNGFTAIEIRGILGQVDLSKCPEFSNRKNILTTRKKAEDKQIKIIGLGSSAALHHQDEAAWQKDLDDAKRFIDLAQQLNCPFVRVFPNKLPKDQNRDYVINLIGERLLSLGNYAKGSNVVVLMETHGDALEVFVIKKIMEAALHPHTGLLWDVCNMWSVTKVPPGKVYPELKQYIRHTHLKDGKFINGSLIPALFGKGECPVFEAVDLLHNDGYKGYYCFEWEKLWYPQIEQPEVAFPVYATDMKNHLG